MVGGWDLVVVAQLGVLWPKGAPARVVKFLMLLKDRASCWASIAPSILGHAQPLCHLHRLTLELLDGPDHLPCLAVIAMARS